MGRKVLRVQFYRHLVMFDCKSEHFDCTEGRPKIVLTLRVRLIKLERFSIVLNCGTIIFENVIYVGQVVQGNRISGRKLNRF